MNVIEAEELSKVYRIYQSPRQRVKEILLRKPLHKKFFALKDLSFSVSKGETLGIIGENGAGKSTLLKIMAGVLKHTSGRIAINGKAAALLELGAGFNPELTGEENIYLNAYLMGLTKHEIEVKKEDIYDFSELGDFIERPVKTYSSGMYVRLAFSIVTSIDPDILIIDEALSVGDQHFQKKCVDRIVDFKNRGKSILFCSHSLYLVQELCKKAIWLKKGTIAEAGNSFDVINAYLDQVRERDSETNISRSETEKDRNAQKKVWTEEVRVTDKEGRHVHSLESGSEVILNIKIRMTAQASGKRINIGIEINRNDDLPILCFSTKTDGLTALPLCDGREVTIRFPSLPLLSGQYYFIVIFTDEHSGHQYDMHRTGMFSLENPTGELGLTNLKRKWAVI